MYKYSKEDYMKLANVSCLDVALTLGMTIDEGGKTTDKSVHIKDSGASMRNALGYISGVIPFCTKAAEAYNQSVLLHSGVSDSEYNKAIKSLANMLMGGKE